MRDRSTTRCLIPQGVPPVVFTLFRRYYFDPRSAKEKSKSVLTAPLFRATKRTRVDWTSHKLMDISGWIIRKDIILSTFIVLCGAFVRRKRSSTQLLDRNSLSW